MEIKVLGTVAPIPSGDMNCPGFLVSHDDYRIMLDCGNGSTRLIDRYKDLKNLIIILSHFHPDHYADIFAMGNLTYIQNKYGYLDERINVYHPKGCESKKDEKQILVPVLIPDHDFIKNTNHEHFLNFNDYSSVDNLTHGDMKITFYKTLHGLNGHAVRIESDSGVLVYSGDTGYDENIKEFAKNADAFICEATFLRGQLKGENTHLYAHEAGRLASLAQVKDLYLFHTYPDFNKEDYVNEAKEIFPNTHSLREGQILTLNKEANL
ncbi:MAG: MBL fold metallo-hydrolase [Erysipelotrichales bacterium]|nr:MBL fold metallo-hydrolase [Erysipelotrichales bacterium]